jgi:DNA-binding response OmpR family regulator
LINSKKAGTPRLSYSVGLAFFICSSYDKGGIIWILEVKRRRRNMGMETILLIEDDEGLSRGIDFTLSKEGYQVLTAKALSQGMRLVQENPVDLILLDLNLPDGDGLEFCKEVRKTSDVPIIVLTARDLETDEIIGFESGADDYITKPFSLSVLKVRISALIRRSLIQKDGGAQQQFQWITSGGIRLCKENCRVYKASEELDLSATEYKLLKLFLEHRRQILLKEQIMEAIWDAEANFVEENTLQVNIRRLRKKLEDDPSQPRLIKTVHGMGYLWNEGTENES